MTALGSGGFSKTAADRWAASRGISVTAYGVFPGTGAIMNAVIQAAIVGAAAAGFNGIIFPGGTYLIDRMTPIRVPAGFTIQGLYGETIFKATGTFPDATVFPVVGQSMFVTADPVTGERYGKELSRRTIGTGAVFTVNASGGVAMSITTTAAGTGYKFGDRLNFLNGTVGYVTGLGSVATGDVTGVTLVTPGSGWGGTSNTGQVQQNATGQNPSDRVFDMNSFASHVYIKDFVMDGDYGFGQTVLPAGKDYNGFRAYGVLNFRAEGIISRNFPGTGIYPFDCRDGTVINCRSTDCGWTAPVGRSRNGFSNVGLYVIDPTAARTLNTRYWKFEGNVAVKCGDVGAQFSNVQNFSIRNNVFVGCGTIAIEGESSSFACWTTLAGSNGIRPPGDGVIAGNIVDGLMVDGTLATDSTSNFNAVSIYAFNGISWTQGNEGRVHIHNNTVQNTSGAGLIAARNSGGVLIANENRLDNVNQGDNPSASPVAPGYTGGATQATGASSGAATQGMRLVGSEVYCERNYVGQRYRGPGIQIGSNANPIAYRANDNEVFGATVDTSASGILLRFSRTSTGGRYIDVSRNRFEGSQSDCAVVEVVNSNTFGVSSLRAANNIARNGNRANVAGTALVVVRTSAGGILNYLYGCFDNNEYIESSLSGNSAIPVVVTNTNSFAPSLISISSLIAPQFATKFTNAPTPNAAAATRTVNNA